MVLLKNIIRAHFNWRNRKMNENKEDLFVTTFSQSSPEKIKIGLIPHDYHLMIIGASTEITLHTGSISNTSMLVITMQENPKILTHEIIAIRLFPEEPTVFEIRKPLAFLITCTWGPDMHRPKVLFCSNQEFMVGAQQPDDSILRLETKGSMEDTHGSIIVSSSGSTFTNDLRIFHKQILWHLATASNCVIILLVKSAMHN